MARKKKTESLQETWRRIRNAVDLSGRPSRTIALLSSHSGEGRSHAAWDLACAYADNGENVLLLESDLSGRSLSQLAGAKTSKGLRDMIKAYEPMKPIYQQELLEQVKTPSGNSLCFIAAGTGDQKDDLISGKAFTRLLKEASRDFDKIILDTPALSESADASVLGALADESLFLYDSSSTSKYDAKEAIEELERNGVRISGIVMTGK